MNVEEGDVGNGM